MFCVECGKEGELHKGLCVDCYLAKNEFIKLPENIDVEICGNCGARRKGKGWVPYSGESFEEILKESASCHPDVTNFDIHLTSRYEDENNILIGVVTHSNVLDFKAEEEHETRLRFKRAICNECSKQAGGYWEAKVQFRGSKRGLSEGDLEKAYEIVESMVISREKNDRGAFLTKVEKIHNGLDFYLGLKSLGKAISKKLASEFGGDVKESHKLVGRKEGKDVYRTTYAVRSSEFRTGDFILLDEKVYRVLNISANKVILRILDSGENISIKPDESGRAKLLGGQEMIKEMVVVSKSDKEIQVLDPDMLKTVDVILPKDFEVRKETVKVVKCESGYFLIGDE